MLRNKIIRFKKIYKFYLDHFFIKWTVFVLNVKNMIKNQKLNFSSAKREYRDENVFLKGDTALSKLITLLISNKKEFNHFFKSRSFDIVLLKVGAKFIYVGARSATITYIGARSATSIRSRAQGALILASEASRFFLIILKIFIFFRNNVFQNYYSK